MHGNRERRTKTRKQHQNLLLDNRRSLYQERVMERLDTEAEEKKEILISETRCRKREARRHRHGLHKGIRSKHAISFPLGACNMQSTTKKVAAMEGLLPFSHT